MSRLKFCSCGDLVDINEICKCKSYRRKETQKAWQEKNAESLKAIQSPKWRRLRLSIINRDGGYCQRCLLKYGIITSSHLTVHHIKPRIKYPELIFEESNLITLCRTCNSQLGTDEELDFVPKEIEDSRDYNL